MKFDKFITLICLLLYLPASENAYSQDKANNDNFSNKKKISEIIPITTANLRGHQALFKEGWFVVSSSEKSLKYANQKSLISSRTAVLAAVSSIASRNQDFKSALLENYKNSIIETEFTFKLGQRLTQSIVQQSDKLANIQSDFAVKSFSTGLKTLIEGNLYLAQRTEETRQQLVNQPQGYFRQLKKDFSNIYEITSDLQLNISKELSNDWDNAFQQSIEKFNAEYEQSGDQSNTLTGLYYILKGYAKAIYTGLFEPASKATITTASVGGRSVGQAIFLPAATTISVAGRTIQAIGNTIYYTGKLGVEIISPTVEAGFLSGMALLSSAASPITRASGATIGVINQMAFTAISPVAGLVSGGIKTGVDSAKFVTLVSYDTAIGSAKVTIHQSSTAIVLGYNALTAIPSHMLMGLIDSAVFLAWDGPRLVLASAKGEVEFGNSRSRIDNLPVGSVIELNSLKNKSTNNNTKNQNIEIQIISDDSELINKILEQSPNDFRE